METITFKKRIASALIAMAVMMSMLSIEILAAIPVHAEPSAINVKVRVNTENNKPAKAYDVTVDGSESESIYFEDNDEISAVDVLVAVHKKEFGTPFDGNETDYVFVDSEFGAVNPFWKDSEVEAIKTYKNNKEVELKKECASEGDVFAFAKVQDLDMYSDKYIYFDGDVKTETNGDISVKVKSYSVEYDEDYNTEKDEVLKDAEVEFKSEHETLTAKTGEDGVAKVTATRSGTFEVSVKSTPYDYAYFPPVEIVEAGPKSTIEGDFTAKEDDKYIIDKATWKTYGINYTDINFERDVIVDIRNTTDKTKNNYVDIVNGPHFVFCKKADVTAGQILTDSARANLDAVETGGKRMVFICYSGNAFARVAMQWANEKGMKLGAGEDSQATYLIGGAGGVLTGNDDAHNEAYKYNLGIGFNDITTNDVILDVRSKDNFDKGHLPGAVHVDVTDEDGKLSDKDKTDMAAALAKVPNGARLVIVCNSGNSLAYKAMAYFMADKTTAGLENLKKASYLIGGDKVIPADKKVTTEEENKPSTTEEVKDGQTATVGGNGYKVLSAKAGTAAFTKAANKKSVTVPDTVKINGKTLKVTQINAGAFRGKKIKTVTVGKNVNKIAKNAFKGSKATKMIVKTKNLKKASVKGSLKGSKIKTVQVKVGKKKVNKKYVKKYKKIFTKKNAGKKVKVK